MMEYIVDDEEIYDYCRSCFGGGLYKQEIIRCRDCKFSKQFLTTDILECSRAYECAGIIYGEKTYVPMPVKSDGFCAWAERASDD